MRPAVLVVDMIVDFTTGEFGAASTRAIRPALKILLTQARKKQIPVIYCQDSHIPQDPELKTWNRHGMFGTQGAQSDPVLKPRAEEWIVPKHTFSSFYGTHLQELLQERKIDTVVLAGVHTHLSIQHTAADAFFRGYHVIVLRDGTAAQRAQEHEQGLATMACTYGASIETVPSLFSHIHKEG